MTGEPMFMDLEYDPPRPRTPEEAAEAERWIARLTPPDGDLWQQAVRRQQARWDREAEIHRLVFDPLPPPPAYGLRRLWLAWRERVRVRRDRPATRG